MTKPIEHSGFNPEKLSEAVGSFLDNLKGIEQQLLSPDKALSQSQGRQS